MRSPMGGIPGIVPGQMALGQSSALAGAPSITGGILILDASSSVNLKPASLNALPKSLSLGKSMWHVLQLRPYMRAKAGIAWLGLGHKNRSMSRAVRIDDPWTLTNCRRDNGCPPFC